MNVRLGRSTARAVKAIYFERAIYSSIRGITTGCTGQPRDFTTESWRVSRSREPIYAVSLESECHGLRAHQSCIILAYNCVTSTKLSPAPENSTDDRREMNFDSTRVLRRLCSCDFVYRRRQRRWKRETDEKPFACPLSSSSIIGARSFRSLQLFSMTGAFSSSNLPSSVRRTSVCLKNRVDILAGEIGAASVTHCSRRCHRRTRCNDVNRHGTKSI